MEKETTIFGMRAIIEAIKSGKTIDKVFVQKGLRSELFQELEYLLRSEGINSAYVPVEKLNRLTKGGNHQGAVAQISSIEFHNIDDLVLNIIESGKTPLFLLLDQLSDVRNFGAIVRTAECTGVSGIIIQKKGGAPINGDTVKTSAGAIFKIPICKVDHIKDAVFHMQSSGIKVIAATEKAKDFIYNVSLKEPCAIIMGSEGKGIKDLVKKNCDFLVSISTFNQQSSINVSNSAAIFLYEAYKNANN